MHEIESTIREINQEVQRTNTEIRKNEAAVGTWLATEPRDEVLSQASEELATALEQRDQLAAQIGEYDSTVETIERLLGEQEALATKTVDLKRELAQLKESSKEHLTRIGDASFTVFRENPLVDQEYADIFAPLLENFELIRDLDRQIEAKEQQIEERSFLDRMVERGRLMLLRNRRSNLAAQTPRLHQTAGKAIVETPFVDALDDPRLTEVAAPYRKDIKRIREIENDLEAISEQNEQINGELASVGTDRGPDRRIASLQEARAETVGSLQEVEATTGRLYLAGSPDVPSQISAQVQSIRELATENDSRRERIRRLQAALRVSQLGDRIDAIDRDIERKELSVQRLQQEIGDLRGKRSQTEEERSQAEQERGDSSELGLT